MSIGSLLVATIEQFLDAVIVRSRAMDRPEYDRYRAILPLAVRLGFSRTAQGRTPTILTANGCSAVLNPGSHCGGRCGVPLDQKRPRAPVRIGPGLDVLGVLVQRAV